MTKIREAVFPIDENFIGPHLHPIVLAASAFSAEEAMGGLVRKLGKGVELSPSMRQVLIEEAQQLLAVLNANSNILNGLTWQEYFKESLPPKYQGVSRSGKAIKFFLKYYRGKELDESGNLTPCNDEDVSKVDYVELGMNQADLRKYDLKLLRAIISTTTYSGTIELKDIIPPLFTTKNIGKLDV